MTNISPARPLRPYVQFFSCLAAAAFVHAGLTLLIVEDDMQELARSQETASAVQQIAPVPNGQSSFTKSNQFMLKDAICNFTNGELVCHRAVGLRHFTKLAGS